MTTATCLHCGNEFTAIRRTRKYCTEMCAWRYRAGKPRDERRKCRECGKEFPVQGKADANRQHCSKACAKRHNTKAIQQWRDDRPGYMTPYNATRFAKNPNEARDRDRRGRLESLRLLGGCCIVCGASNPNWLHLDYIPTTRGKTYRHPRGLAFVRTHLDLFRILCANHHYELTLTGRIEGTDIVQ